MTRHLVDHPAPDDGRQRALRFLRLARAGRPHPASLALHARRPAAPAEARLAPLLRLLRRGPA